MKLLASLIDFLIGQQRLLAAFVNSSDFLRLSGLTAIRMRSRRSNKLFRRLNWSPCQVHKSAHKLHTTRHELTHFEGSYHFDWLESRKSIKVSDNAECCQHLFYFDCSREWEASLASSGRSNCFRTWRGNRLRLRAAFACSIAAQIESIHFEPDARKLDNSKKLRISARLLIISAESFEGTWKLEKQTASLEGH